MTLYRHGDPLRSGKTAPTQTLHGQTRPDHLPRRGNRWTQKLAWWVLRRSGWDIRGLYPDASRLIIIGAPHSSNFDWFWGMLVQWALGVRFSFFIKHVFFVGPLGWVMRYLGGVPVNRRRVRGAVTDAADLFAQHEKIVLFITPEGRTKPVRNLKKGFYKLALAAQVPVLVVSFRYDERVIALDGYLDMAGSFDQVAERLNTHYGPIKGRRRGYLNRLENWAVRPLPKNVKIYD